MKIIFTTYVLLPVALHAQAEVTDGLLEDPFAAWATQPFEVSHLVPIAPFKGNEYESVVFSALIGNRPVALWMIVLPAFESEYAVAISQGGHSEWTLRLIEPKERILRFKSVRGQRPILDVDRPHEVNESHAGISRELGLAVVRAFRGALLQTRYTEQQLRRLDGTRYLFSWRHLHGETWSPSSGVPQLMIELGGSLATLVKEKPDGNSMTTTKCFQLAQEIKEATTKPEQAAAGNRDER